MSADSVRDAFADSAGFGTLDRMESQRTIGDLAREAGVPTSTVRYYERAGFIDPDGRSNSNYRLYGDRALDRLRFIRTAQSAGFTLSDIKSLLELRDGNATRCEEVRLIVERRLEGVEERIDEFKQVRRVLKSFLEICRRSQEDDACGVIEKLDS